MYTVIHDQYLDIIGEDIASDISSFFDDITIILQWDRDLFLSWLEQLGKVHTDAIIYIYSRRHLPQGSGISHEGIRHSISYIKFMKYVREFCISNGYIENRPIRTKNHSSKRVQEELYVLDMLNNLSIDEEQDETITMDECLKFFKKVKI